MPGLLSAVTAVFLLLFRVGRILLVSIFIGRITQKGNEPPDGPRHRQINAVKP